MNKAMRDELTGVGDAGAFSQDVTAAVARADREDSALSIAFCDMDLFKRLNDEHGHEAGDEALKLVARSLQGAVADRGQIYRRGGDEFAVVFYGIEKEEAFLMLEGARSDIEKAGGATGVTISVGLACRPDDGIREKDVVRKAEDAVFRAKSGGRNKVALAKDEKMVTKTSYYTQGQLSRLAKLAAGEEVGEAVLLREALDDLLRKYDR